MTLIDGKMILSLSEWETIQKTIRDDAAAMRKAATRIKRLEEELDELFDILEDDEENAPNTPKPVKTQAGAKGENVVPITKHPKFQTSKPG